MTLRFTVLASGSGGNASLLQTAAQGVLLDCGLGPRQLSQRLASIGASWADVNAVLLTHTHGDHWRETTLNQLHKRGIALWCHGGHRGDFTGWSAAFGALQDADLVRHFDEGSPFAPVPGLRCTPFAVSHDGGPTFGFRIEGPTNLYDPPPTIAYAADLGCWDEETLARLVDTDVLALEFNHDVGLELDSGRAPHLIDRVLGDCGHLSNEQAADLVRAILARTGAGRLRHLVQLHLSRQCNTPELAQRAVRDLPGLGVAVYSAEQDLPGPTLELGQTAHRTPRASRPRRKRLVAVAHPLLPGID